MKASEVEHLRMRFCPQSLTRQNDSMLALDQTWTQPNTLVSGGRALSSGQVADYLLAVPRMIQRG